MLIGYPFVIGQMIKWLKIVERHDAFDGGIRMMLLWVLFTDNSAHPTACTACTERYGKGLWHDVLK